MEQQYPLLELLYSGKSLKAFTIPELEQLCEEIRAFLIESVPKTGGHLASNLGAVELTVALHYVFDIPQDHIIFDVGHQSYTHKILTGRWKEFSTLRQKDGLSGFPRTGESDCDAFLGGHSSISVSAGFGLSKADALQGKKNYTIAVIGDGAFTGGMVYEALNNAGKSEDNLIVVLNHNEMAISMNVGSFAKYLNRVRGKPHYLRMKRDLNKILTHIPLIGNPLRELLLRCKALFKRIVYGNNLFEDLGFLYFGPVNGHRLESLIWEFNRAKECRRPILVHVDTVKGKGFPLAEQDPQAFHGIAKMDLANPDMAEKDSFSSVAGQALADLADNDDRICAITAAMEYGTGLQHFSEKHRSRFFDVGIAEEHAVTFASAMAAGGMLPVFAVYSTFLQRAYDQVIHDASIEPRHIVLAIDRAGVVGADGETHQGIFDVAFLRTIPHITLYAPSDYAKLRVDLKKALYDVSGVAAVRYPRGVEQPITEAPDVSAPSEYYLFGSHSRILILTYGRLVSNALAARDLLQQQGIMADVLQLERLLPVSEEAVNLAMQYEHIFFFEEGILSGGMAEGFLSCLNNAGFSGRYDTKAITDFVPQASVEQSLQSLGLDRDGIANFVREHLS